MLSDNIVSERLILRNVTINDAKIFGKYGVILKMKNIWEIQLNQ